MRKIFTLLLALFAIATTARAQVIINETNFPDPKFREWVLAQSYGQDGKLTTMDISGVRNIVVNNQGIKNLKGIEFFTQLESLHCDSNSIERLDVSNNEKLGWFYCSNNELTELKLPAFQDSLKIIYCDRNKLKSLDVSKYKKLVILSCYNNQLESLDISNSPNMVMLYCFNNKLTELKMPNTREVLMVMRCHKNLLKSLDLSDCPILQELHVDGNQLTELNVANCPKLATFYCNNNKIKGAAMQKFLNSLTALPELRNLRIVDLDEALGAEENEVTRKQAAFSKSKNWRMLAYKNSSWNNELLGHTTGIEINETNFPDPKFRDFLCQQIYGQDSTLTASEIQEVTILELGNKGLTNLKGIEYFTALKELNCHTNQFTELNLSACTELEELFCNGTPLTTLDISKNTKLKRLTLRNNNQLAELNLSGCTNLESLDCEGNQITKLDVSGHSVLTYLICSNNDLTELNVKGCTAMKSLQSQNNQLTALDLTGCTSLNTLYIQKNKINGEDMTTLVNSLCNRTGTTSGKFYAIDLKGADEENACEIQQVAIAKGKNWNVYAKSTNDYVEYNPTIEREGIDLGLASRVKWANMNIGAEWPEDYGDYFMWGDTAGHKGDASDGFVFSWANYKWCDGAADTWTKYNYIEQVGKDGFTDYKMVLDPEDDAATVHWGEGWRMPTTEEIEELIACTTQEWTTQYGVAGVKFTAENGNSIFLPAAGTINRKTPIQLNYKGYYWSASLWTMCDQGDNLEFREEGETRKFREERYFGCTIRPVFGKNQTPTGIGHIDHARMTNADAWYTLDGKKLSGEPTQRGIYIHGGRKVIK